MYAQQSHQRRPTAEGLGRRERAQAKALLAEGEFIEVFIDTPIAVCESRDPKGLYKKARAGEIKDFTGISSGYDVPKAPTIHIKTDELSIVDCAQQVIDYLLKHKFIEKV